MKKTFLFAALAALSMVSCTNNELPEAEPGYGYINVNVSNDVTVTTRAEQTLNNIDGWTVTATNTTSNNPTQLSLGDNSLLAGSYTVVAKNASNMAEAAAKASTSYKGQAYYESTPQTVNVSAGNTTKVTLNCGRAKNSKLTLVNSLNDDLFTDVKLHAKTANDGDSYLELSHNESAFYAPTTVVSYYISYKYTYTTSTANNESTTTTVDKELKNNNYDFTITIMEAAYNYKIELSSNQNGKINVTIKYDDTFTDSETSFTFDAATGTGSQNQ